MVLWFNSGFSGQWAAGTWRCPSAFFTRSGCAKTHFPWCPKVPGYFFQMTLVNSWFQNSDFLAPKLTANSFLCNWQYWSLIHPHQKGKQGSLHQKALLYFMYSTEASSCNPPLGVMGRLEGLCLFFYCWHLAWEFIWRDALLDIPCGFGIQWRGLCLLFSLLTAQA